MQLGGVGPDSGSEEVRYSDVGMFGGAPFDLVVRATSAVTRYAAEADGGYSGCEGAFGKLKVRSGSSVDLRFSFERPSGASVTLPRFFFSAFDLADEDDRLVVNGFSSYDIPIVARAATDQSADNTAAVPLEGLTQVASGLPVTLSTVYPYDTDWGGRTCSDGIIDPPNCGSWCSSHCATNHLCTQASPCNWLALTLPASTKVGKVAIYNRRDSYPNIPNIQSWLGEVEVWLGSSPGGTDGIKCGTVTYDAAHEPNPYVRSRPRAHTTYTPLGLMTLT